MWTSPTWYCSLSTLSLRQKKPKRFDSWQPSLNCMSNLSTLQPIDQNLNQQSSSFDWKFRNSQVQTRKSFPTTPAQKSFWKRESSCSLSLVLNDMTQNWWQSSQSNCRLYCSPSRRSLAYISTYLRKLLSSQHKTIWILTDCTWWYIHSKLYHTSDIVSADSFFHWIVSCFWITNSWSYDLICSFLLDQNHVWWQHH